MKYQNTKHLILSLAIALSVNVAQAQSFGDTFSGFKNKVTEAAKAAAAAAEKAAKAAAEKVSESTDSGSQNSGTKTSIFKSSDKVVADSILVVTEKVPADIKWVMVMVQKGEFSEQLLYPVVNGEFSASVSLQDGAGLYDIGIYTNKNENRYTSYTQLKKFKADNSDIRDMQYLLPTPKAQMDDPRIVELVKELTKDAQDEEEAFLAIYNYITKTIKYDYVSLRDGSYVKIDYSALYTLENSTAVCEGYANLLAAMSRAYGIKTKVIFGKGRVEAHAWNEVYIHDEWRLVDATWDAGRKNSLYLFMSEEDFSKDHTKEMVMKY